MQIRDALIVVATAAFMGTALLAGTPQDAPQQAPAPAPAPAPQGGRGAGPAGQGQGGGGAAARQGGAARGPNFAQQQRPPGDPAVIARGRALFGINCTACHGADLRGGDQGGPNLLRSQTVLTDLNGEKIIPILRNGRQGALGVMPSFPNPEQDLLAISEYIHSVAGQLGRQGRPPERDTPFELNVLVGDANAGKAYFDRACGRCHSASGDLQGVAAKVADPRALQNLWISGGRAGGPGGGGGGDDAANDNPVKVTVTPANGPAVTGRLVRIDDFLVSLVGDDGIRRTFQRAGATPRVQVDDPLRPHRLLVLELGDRDMHNITAYLATLR